MFAPASRRPYPLAVQKANALRQLFVYERIEDILRSGITDGWSNNPNHHADYDFLTMRKRFKVPGEEEKWMTVDLKVKRSSPEKKVVAHNASMTGNPGFALKQKHWNTFGDEYITGFVFELCDVTIN